MSGEQLGILAGAAMIGAALYFSQKPRLAVATLGQGEGPSFSLSDFLPDSVSEGFALAMGRREPRGIRNNNPGNIRHGPSNWQGMSGSQSDRSFVQFDSPVMGLRALAVLLRNYHGRYRLQTVGQIIARYAPPSENNSEAYINAVAARLGVSPDEPFEFTEKAGALLRAIVKHENGKDPYTPEQYAEALARAGV